MDKQIANSPSNHIASASLLIPLGILSIAVSFYSQASALSYPGLLRLVLLFGCLPQALLLSTLSRIASRKLFLAGSIITIISWLFVSELVVRVLAA